MSPHEIAMAIDIKRKTIERSVLRESKSKKYFSEDTIEKDLPIIKEYYSYFEVNKD